MEIALISQASPRPPGWLCGVNQVPTGWMDTYHPRMPPTTSAPAIPRKGQLSFKEASTCPRLSKLWICSLFFLHFGSVATAFCRLSLLSVIFGLVVPVFLELVFALYGFGLWLFFSLAVDGLSSHFYYFTYCSVN